MSDLIAKPQISDSKDCPLAGDHPVLQKIQTREAQIGEHLTIRRALPNAQRRMIGAWCFFDHFGPLNLKTDDLNIAPHPHMGLQTFTWTLHGEILHRDSLGSKQIIKPGQVNLMTSGQGISHSEESLPDSVLHGVQLWIALPGSLRHMDPEFAHYPTVPERLHQGLQLQIIAGEFWGERAPAKVHSPLVGVALNAQENTEVVLPLNPSFEYGILPLVGECTLEDHTVDLSSLLYLGCGRKQVSLRMRQGAQALLIGGEPFKEEIVMWWNFVARSEAELLDAVRDWEEGDRFGHVQGYSGDRLHAPEINCHK